MILVVILFVKIVDLTYLFVQCKNYSTTGNDNTISIHDLSDFYNFIAETGFNCSVYYSCKLSTHIIYYSIFMKKS
jgi:hypothetical protein